ncbi:MAG: hypothetical protein U5K33_07915 [Halofilum sp. (in: g-proteobacteria)]|jgi:hypothetical protein|nr:hypothetical protein [Halofilum sp. (in: g-proteobacteria)]
MASVLQTYVNMLQLRAGPQDLPASDRVFLGSVAALIGVSLLVATTIYPARLALVRIGIDLLLQIVVVASLLHWAGHPRRFRQTFAAMCGTGVLLILLMWPLIDILHDRAPEETLTGAATIGLFGLYGWSIAVIAHILRHALELRMAQAVLLALGYFIGSVIVVETLAPVPGP